MLVLLGSSLLLLAAGSAVAVADADSGGVAGSVAHDGDPAALETGDRQAALVGDGPNNVDFGVVEGEERGDVVEIQLTGISGEYATVTLGSSDAGYQSNVTVRDDGNGIVTLQWNSYLADADQTGDGNPWSATGGTVVAQNVRTAIADGPEHVITAGSYTLAARGGRIQDGAASDPPDALTEVTLSERSTESIDTFTARGPLETELTSTNDVSSRIGDTVVRDEDIAKGDLLITRIEASGLEGALRAQNGGDATANFYGAVAAGVVRLNHTERIDDATNRNADVSPVTARETGDTVTVLADYESGEYYVVHNTTEDDRLGTGTAFETQFTVESRHRSQANFGLVPPDSSGNFQDSVLASEFDVVRGSYDIGTTPQGVVQVRAQSGQTIGGTSSYAPGTTFSVVIESQSGSPFIIGPREVSVEQDGSWATTVDFSSYDAGTTFTVDVARGTDEATSADGEIRGPPEVLALQFDDQQSRGSVATVSEVELNSGGFVVLREDSVNGPIIGYSSYVDEDTLTQDLQIVLDQRLTSSTTLVAIPHLDGNNNQEFDPSTDDPYTSGGAPVTDSARLQIEGGEPDFVVRDFQQSAAAVPQGGSYNVTATVANEGGTDGSATVEYRFDGRTVRSQSVSLQSGAAQTVRFVGLSTSQSPGTYSHGVSTGDDSVTRPITVETAAGSSNYAIERILPGDTTVPAGETVTVRAALTNNGDTSGQQEVVLRVDGQQLSTVSASLASGETDVVTFPQDIAADALGAGDHTYTVSTDDDSQTSRLTVEGSTANGTVESLAISQGSATSDGMTISSAELSSGGFVAAHVGSPSGPVVGVSGYLEGGREYQNVPISFSESVANGTSVVAVAHYDTNDNEAFDYASGSSTDRAYSTGSSNVASQQVSTQDDTDGTPSGGSKNAGTTTTTESGDGGDGSDEGIVGGFGPIPLAGAAIVVLGIVGVGAYTVLGGSDGSGGDGPDSPGEPAATESGDGDSPPARASEEAGGAVDASQRGSLTESQASGPGTGDATDAAGAGAAGTAGAAASDGPAPHQPDDAVGPAEAGDAGQADATDAGPAGVGEPGTDGPTDQPTAGRPSDQPAADARSDSPTDAESADPPGDETQPEPAEGEPEPTADDGEPQSPPVEGAEPEPAAGEGVEPSGSPEPTPDEPAGDDTPAEPSGANDSSAGEPAAGAGGEAATPDEAADDAAPDETASAESGGGGSATDAAAGAGAGAAGAAAGAGASGADGAGAGGAGGTGAAGAGAGAGAAAGAGGAGPGGAGGGAPDPLTALEQGVPSLNNLQQYHVGPALATYGASMATADGDLPVEVLTVAPDVPLEPGLIDRFETIADMWFNASTHANVRTVHDWGVDPRPYLTVDGLPNAQPFGQARTSMTLDQTVTVVNDVAAALDATGFHLDLSLDCIKLLAGGNGYTAVVDGWGLERTVMEFTEGQYVTGYTAPEQVTGDPVDERADVYGLGAVTYHAMTGRTPVQPDDDAVRQGPPSHANEFVQIPPQADVAIMTALATEPADRQPTPGAYGQALSNAFW